MGGGFAALGLAGRDRKKSELATRSSVREMLDWILRCWNAMRSGTAYVSSSLATVSSLAMGAGARSIRFNRLDNAAKAEIRKACGLNLKELQL